MKLRSYFFLFLYLILSLHPLPPHLYYCFITSFCHPIPSSHFFNSMVFRDQLYGQLEPLLANLIFSSMSYQLSTCFLQDDVMSFFFDCVDILILLKSVIFSSIFVHFHWFFINWSFLGSSSWVISSSFRLSLGLGTPPLFFLDKYIVRVDKSERKCYHLVLRF